MTTPSTGAPTSFDERYRAIDARDRRFDGQFITAVRTTGIYCRPSCPARTPKPENVTFYRTSAAAHEAGYRACKRCLPEAVPGTPDWNITHDVAARSMRLITDGVVDRDGVGGLAARLGYSERHLGRLLHAELGAGPLALARAARAQTARALVTGTDLPLADVAFAAGFGSIRQFNDTVAEVYGLTPTALRATRRRAESPGRHDGGTNLTLNLPVREPYDDGVFGFLAARAVDGVETVVGEPGAPWEYSRALALPHGDGLATARWDGRFSVRLALASLADLPVAVARLRRLFDLDADPAAVDAVLAADPALAPRVAAVPGIRVPGAVDPHEIVIRAMVGQQISVAAARTHLGRLAELGAPLDPPAARDAPDTAPRPARQFPTAAAIAEHGRDHLRGPRRRIESVVTVAGALADGSLVVGPAEDPTELRAALLAQPGIGPWTADYVAMRVLGDPDVLLPRDVALAAGASALGLPPLTPESTAHWSPWRSYAALHLWRTPTRKAL
ncbi:AlkA N-terminal domain-containing protein [Paraoerskovia marina]|uniref:AlkA N-terminal domain-containing protein n=1 Tax=Paraoerskovia marina TaxID=545619 RepID=UPI000492723F|nr:AlkA N-terminal domain-containing protein [Paraoerskovia marina]